MNKDILLGVVSTCLILYLWFMISCNSNRKPKLKSPVEYYKYQVWFDQTKELDIPVEFNFMAQAFQHLVVVYEMSKANKALPFWGTLGSAEDSMCMLSANHKALLHLGYGQWVRSLNYQRQFVWAYCANEDPEAQAIYKESARLVAKLAGIKQEMQSIVEAVSTSQLEFTKIELLLAKQDADFEIHVLRETQKDIAERPLGISL